MQLCSDKTGMSSEQGWLQSSEDRRSGRFSNSLRNMKASFKDKKKKSLKLSHVTRKRENNFVTMLLFITLIKQILHVFSILPQRLSFSNGVCESGFQIAYHNPVY